MSLVRTFLPAICYIFSTIGCSAQTPPDNKGAAVIELYTSEGCSSCPSAEAVLAQIHNDHRQNVYVMEFHVDYWNGLGWKDEYSSNEYTKRQQHYAQLFHLNSTYTPQAVINGSDQLVGSDKAKMQELVNASLRTPSSTIISLSADKNGNVTYNISNSKDRVLTIALVQKKAETNVRRGENSGRKLSHINVVRSLQTINEPANKGTVNIAIPAGLKISDCSIICFAQMKGSLKVTGASETAIN